jgi:peptidyl-prolyl cis-trans isomerase D
MLRKMRNDFKRYSWTLWIVMIAFLVGFSFTDPFRSGSGSDTDLFKIAGVTISGDRYYSEVLQTLEYYSKQFNNKISQSLINQMRVPEQVLQRLINSTIIEKEAEAFEVSVSDEELSEKIKNYSIVRQDEKKGPVRVYLFREMGQASGNFIGKSRYEELLAMNRIKVKEFEAEKKEEIIGEKFMQLVTGALVIDNETLKEKYKQENDNVSLDFIVLRTDRIKEKVQVNDETLKEYYDKNKEDFKTREKRTGSVVAFKFDDFKKDLKISDKQLFDYYRENKDTFIVPGKTMVSRIFLKYDDKNRDEIFKKAESLQKELTPENFAQKAREFSQDEKANQGGDYGYQGWTNFTEQEKALIDGLEEKGISSPIDTLKGGFSLVLVSQKVEKHQEAFDKVKTRIKDSFEKQQLNQIVQNKLTKIYNKLKDEKDIKSKAESLKVEVLETGAINNNDPIKDVDEAGYISRVLFSLEEGKVSAPIEFMKGVAIVQLTGIIKPEIEPFEKVKEKVKTKVETVKKIEMLSQDSLRISEKLNSLNDETAIEKFLKDEKLSSTANEYKRGNRLSYLPEKEDLDKIIFSLDEGRFSSPIKFANQVAIVKVKSKKVTDEMDFEENKAVFYNQKLNDLKANFFSSYIGSAREKYKIKNFNEKLYKNIKEQIMAKFKN